MFADLSVAHQPGGDDGPPSRPLPMGAAPPELAVRSTPADGVPQLVALLSALAPADKVYAADCRQADSTRTQLSVNIQTKREHSWL